MNCYLHQSNSAVALCRICYRGMCNTCVPSDAVDITCSPICTQIVESQYSQSPHDWVFTGMGLVFLGFGSWFSITDKEDYWPYFLIMFGLIFIIGQILHRSRINRGRKSLHYPGQAKTNRK